jgi:hypothetical protein
VQKYLLLLAIITCLLRVPAVAQQESAKQFYEIRPCLREITLERTTSTGTVLAEPRVQVVENREADLNVGGKEVVGEEEVPSGIVLRVKVKPVAGKTVQASGVLEVSETGHPENENDVVIRESCAIHFNKTIELGHPMRVQISKTSEKERWFELSVSAVPNSINGQTEDQPAVVKRAAKNVIPHPSVK